LFGIVMDAPLQAFGACSLEQADLQKIK